MKITLKKDSHLFNYSNHFGSTVDFLPTLFVGADTLNDIEPTSSVLCTTFTADKVKSGETGKLYDHQWLWSQMQALGETTGNGASPQDAFATAVKGQRVVPTGEIETSAAYFRVDQGPYDAFTNTKSAMQNEYDKGFKRPVGCGTNWYDEWRDVTLMPMGKTEVSEHEWEIVGWSENYPDCFQIDSHEGYYKYIPRDVFNAAMNATWGAVALTLAETTQEEIDYLKSVKVSLLQQALDLAYNIYKILLSHLSPQ